VAVNRGIHGLVGRKTFAQVGGGAGGGGGGKSVNRLELACSSHRAKLGSRHGDMG